MEKLLKIAVVLTAYDRMSRVVRDATDSAKKSMNEAFGKGAGYMASGAAIVASLAPAVQAFAELEDSSTKLQTAMMAAGGAVRPEFEAINKLAIELGNQLPGTTADFQNMFEVMLNNGIESQTILNDVGKAAAYLAVALKMPYDEAAKFASKLKESVGVADKDMMGFLDTIARVKILGVEASEMQYAFGRSAGALKLLGIQGLQASKDLATVFAPLLKSNSGETVGTAFSGIFNNMLDAKKMAKVNEEAAKLGVSLQFFKDGKFMGVPNMVAQLDKLKNFLPAQRASVVNALTGGGADSGMLQTIITNGVAGFNKINQKLQDQATLSQKVEAQLKTLKNIWDATTGTITNMLAALGAGIAPELKAIADLFGKLAGSLQNFFATYPAFAKFLGLVVAGTGIFLTVVGVINMVKGAFIALRVVMLANPFMLIATAAIMAVAAIYANWDKITAFFKNVWETIKREFTVYWNFITSLLINGTTIGQIYKNWDKITAFFGNLWERVKGIFVSWFQWSMSINMKFYDAGANIVKNIWEGIKSMANKPIEAIKEMAGKIRDFFPFSPAKAGPLKDIHRIKLVETIADGIKPDALVKKVNGVANAVFNVKPNAISPQLAIAGGGGSTSVSFNISFAGTASREGADAFMGQLRKYESEIVRMISSAQARRERTKF